MATQGRRSGAQGARCQPSTHIVPSFSLPAALSEILDGAVENENWDPCLILYRYPSIQSSFQCLFFLSVVRGTRVLCFFRLALSRDFCFIRASFLGFPLPLYGCPCRFLAPLLPGLSFLAVLSSSCHRCSGLVISNSYRRRHRMLLAIREENQKQPCKGRRKFEVHSGA